MADIHLMLMIMIDVNLDVNPHCRQPGRESALPEVPLITPGGQLPAFSLPMRLHHYSVRSLAECQRKAAFISTRGTLFADQRNRGKQMEKRCHREDDVAEHWIEHAVSDRSIGSREHATEIKEAIQTIFGAAGLEVFAAERQSFREDLAAFLDGGRPDF